MKVCMVTPHLPPDQAANALLPALLGEELVRRGHEVSFVTFTPRHGEPVPRSETLYVRRPPNGWVRTLRLAQLSTVLEISTRARGMLREADVVHIHSNTFMNQVSAWWAHASRRPFVLTQYGTEIWHYRKRRLVDPFLWMNHHAAHVAYYSRRLLERALELGVSPASPSRQSVVYPPVGTRFHPVTEGERRQLREALGAGRGPVLINVKRLHPLAGQVHLVDAMPEVLRRFPDAVLWIAGEGVERPRIEARVRERELGGAVRLLGLVDNEVLPRYYAAADLFVLPSLLEAFPTVAAEALASGLPVVSADHPGGLELRELFPDDVTVVPRGDTGALARSILEALTRKARVSEAGLSRIERELRPSSAVAKYLDLYRAAIASGGELA